MNYSKSLRLSPPSAYISDTGTAKGRGVFAGRNFSANEIVEICPVVLFKCAFDNLPPEAKTLVFNWTVLAGQANTHALALGFGSMYNHNNPANMRYEANPTAQLLRFVAVHDIKKGEELTVNYNAYGGGAIWHNDNWFERMGVTPLNQAREENPES